ncbi:MAG TPA: hypothetical protein P5056_00010 [Candidatus Paceibacterota bacterium]|nr:hypothetical protein [Candidatus Paceibacterota bacterium]
MKKPGSFTLNVYDGKHKKLRIVEISEAEVVNYKTLGIGVGLDVYHCVYMGTRYTKNFLDRVVAYRILDSDDQVKKLEKQTGQVYMRIEFFENKKRKRVR